jgi:hypothetical protein
MQGWLQVKRAAKYAGVSSNTLRGWMKSGLRYSRLPTGTILIKIEWIDNFIEQHEFSDNELEKIVNEVMKDFKVDNNNRRYATPQACWREKVLRKDKNICQICGSQQHLVAHHIESYNSNPTLRLDVKNGITLYTPCHIKFHSIFGAGNNTGLQLEEFRLSETKN